MYSECLASLEMSVPVNLNTIVQFVKKLGVHVRQSIQKRAQSVVNMKNTIDSVYVLYVLSTGLIDDVDACLKCFQERDWKHIPIQVQIISLSPSHISREDQDTRALNVECNRLNRIQGWPQF
jgi:hypothetical protein